MNEIKITPEILQQYALMTKNEILLHLALRTLASDGKMKRNVRQMCKMLEKTERRVRDAEDGLKRRGLLRIHWIRNQRWWYVYDHPVGEEMTEGALISVPQAAPGVQECKEKKKRRSLWRKLRDAIVGTRLNNFDLEEP